MLARNRLAMGDVAEASACLETGLATAVRHGHCLTCNALLLPEAVRVALASDRMAEADRFASDLEAIALKFGSHAWRAMAKQARGRVQAARGEGALARATLAEAASLYEAIGAPYDVARCLAAAGRTDEAARAFKALGAPGIEG